ncbi:Pvc16 family protein [Streptomyces sp. NPDC002935]|uniref:Pvc16 family protein n=1 Tax=Streptomyces sp. NPDC002935 TaxID=3154545 RepID=UPI0033A7D400
MSEATALGMVSASLRTLLTHELGITPPPDVTVLSPDETGGARRLNLFLFRVVEHPFFRNQDWEVRPGTPPHLTRPPLSLSLSYLLTAYAPNDPQTGNAAAHQLLGEAMRVLHEHPEIPEEYLDTGLLGAKEKLQIVGENLDPDGVGRLWSSLDEPFRLSVAYQVSPVQLDVSQAAQRPMPQRVRRVGVPDVRAPLDPPVVTEMSPVSGMAGTPLTFTGKHLAGWRARVWVGGHPVVSDQLLGEDRFTAQPAGDLGPGLYEVRVDVSGIFRRAFLFEVTS